MLRLPLHPHCIKNKLMFLAALISTLMLSIGNAVERPKVDFTADLPQFDEASVTAVIHVDASAPRAGADGSAERPFPSIGATRAAMMRNLESGIPTRIRIGPGTYREDLRQWLLFRPEVSDTARETLLIVEGDPEGGTVLSGSVEQHGQVDFRPDAWIPVSGEPGLYENRWPFHAPPDAGPWIDTYGFAMLPGVMQRSEMVWLNGQRLRQVLGERYRWEDPDGPAGYADRGTGRGGDPDNQPGKLVFDSLALADPTDLKEPWTFVVYNSPEAPPHLQNRVFVRIPEDLSISDFERIEVSHWKGSAWAPLLRVQGKHNLIIRDLHLKHGTTGPMGTAMAINNTHRFVVERLRVNDNVASSISVVSSSRGIFRKIETNNNGGNGIAFGNGSNRMLVEDSETSFNNYRGAWAGWLAWHASASKSGGVRDIIFRRHVSVGNYANGLWFDVYCRNILAEDSFFYGNKRMGVMYELTRPRGGPHILHNSIAAFNDNTGIFISMASNTWVTDSLLIGNGGGGFVENEQFNTQILYKFTHHPQGPQSAEDWESVVIRGNIIASVDGRMSDYLSRRSDPATQFPDVVSILNTDHNIYWSSEPRGFRLPDGSWGDLDAWRALLAELNSPGQEASSRWQDPGLDPNPRIEFTPASSSRLTQKAREMGIPLPEAQIREYWKRRDLGLYEPPFLMYQIQHD
jgi:hypothetical protein